MQNRASFLGSAAFDRVLQNLDVKCLDIGARGGFNKDLLPMAKAVHAIGFEPDQGECERLNASVPEQVSPWRSESYVPVALGAKEEMRTLHFYRHAGCSSLLEAEPEVARQFCREDYVVPTGTASVKTTPLDDAAKAYDFEDAAYLKIDVQGAELEVFHSGPQLVEKALLAVRAEVSWIPLYRGQPLYGDLDRYFQTRGYQTMGFLEMHHWRRTTRCKLPRLATDSFPYSKGQLVHGDVLWLRDPNLLTDDSPSNVRRCITAGLIALCYGHVDYAAVVLRKTSVAEHLRAHYGVDIDPELHLVSRWLARSQQPQRWKQLRRRVSRILRRVSGFQKK